MTFSEYLEWEGNKFAQEPEMVNPPDFPNSRWKGPGQKSHEPSKERKIRKSFGTSRLIKKIPNYEMYFNRPE